MSVRRALLKHALDYLLSQHALTPCFDVGPIPDFHAEEGEHPRHCVWKVGQVGDAWSIGQSNIVLIQKAQAFV